MRRNHALILMLVLTLALTGCASMKGLFTTAVSLEALGDQFVATTEQVTIGCADKSIPADACERYRVFGLNFKKVYPQTVGLWKAARAANDTAAMGAAEDVARQLSRDLTKIASEILKSFLPQEVK